MNDLKKKPMKLRRIQPPLLVRLLWNLYLTLPSGEMKDSIAAYLSGNET